MDMEARRSAALGGADIATYRELGYVVLRRFLQPADCNHLVDAVTRLFGAAGANQVSAEEARAGVFFRSRGFWRLLPEVEAVVRAVELGRVISSLTGEETILFAEDETIVLAPGALSGGVYARDPGAARFRAAAWLSAIIPLQKTGAEPVEIELLNGSQTLEAKGPGPGQDLAVDPHRIARVALDPGDVLLKHPRVFACFAASPVPRSRGTLWLRAGGAGLTNTATGEKLSGPDHPVIWPAF